MKSFTREVVLDSQSTDGLTDQIELDINIYADEEDDSYYELDMISNITTGKVINFDSLCDEEQNKIIEICDGIAYDFGYEVWLDSQISAAEDLMDRYKEGE